MLTRRAGVADSLFAVHAHSLSGRGVSSLDCAAALTGAALFLRSK